MNLQTLSERLCFLLPERREGISWEKAHTEMSGLLFLQNSFAAETGGEDEKICYIVCCSFVPDPSGQCYGAGYACAQG